MNPHSAPTHLSTSKEIRQLQDQDTKPGLTPDWKLHLSLSHLAGLLDRMPFDFMMDHRSEFNFITDLGMRGKPKKERLLIILDSMPMQWLKSTHPLECSEAVLRLVKKVPANEVAEIGRYLLSGPFIKNLAYKHPQAYGEFFLGLVGMMEDTASRSFAKVNIADQHNGVYSVIPERSLQLPPLALLHSSSGSTHIRPVDACFARSLSPTTRETLQRVFSNEADLAARAHDFGSSAHLLSAAKVLEPRPD